jgi:predicted nucleic acid-binding protein
LVEAANVLWRRCRPGKLTAGEAQDCLHELLNAPVAAASIQTDLPAAAHLAGQLHHLVNDCLYLAMAIRKDTYVVTADRRFYDVVAGAADLADRVRLL